jgi:phytoene dehydrogenase-like protein
MRVLVVGAAVGGLTTALSLHAAGADVLVVDAVRNLLPSASGSTFSRTPYGSSSSSGSATRSRPPRSRRGRCSAWTGTPTAS